MAVPDHGICCVCDQPLCWENLGQGPTEGYKCEVCLRWVCPSHAVLVGTVGTVGPVYCPDCDPDPASLWRRDNPIGSLEVPCLASR